MKEAVVLKKKKEVWDSSLCVPVLAFQFLELLSHHDLHSLFERRESSEDFVGKEFYF